MKTTLCILLLALVTTAKAQTTGLQLLAWKDSNNAFSRKVPVLSYTMVKPDGQLVKEIPKDMYTRNFGFFCKQELKLHQAHVPLTFRLGSMEYCNMLEQKGSR